MSALYKEFTLNSNSVWDALRGLILKNAKAFMESGKPLRVIVTSSERKRNVEQNARLWGYLYKQIAENAWVGAQQFDADTWHEFFARKFGACKDVTLPSGEVIIVRNSSTEMTVAEFSEFMQKIETYAVTELGVEFQ